MINGLSTGMPASLKYGGNVSVTGNGVSGIIVGDNDTGKAEITVENDGTVTVNNGTSTSAGIYEYMETINGKLGNEMMIDR